MHFSAFWIKSNNPSRKYCFRKAVLLNESKSMDSLGMIVQKSIWWLDTLVKEQRLSIEIRKNGVRLKNSAFAECENGKFSRASDPKAPQIVDCITTLRFWNMFAIPTFFQMNTASANSVNLETRPHKCTTAQRSVKICAEKPFQATETLRSDKSRHIQRLQGCAVSQTHEIK